MEENKNVPELRFPGFSGEWVENRLGEVCDVIDGDRGLNYPKLEDFSSHGHCLFLTAKNVTKHGFKFDDTQFITEEKDQLLRKGKLKRADIVITTRGTVGNFAYFDNNVETKHIRINSGMAIIRNKSTSKTRYFYIFFHSPQFKMELKRILFGSAQPQLTIKEIERFRVRYPTLQEQTKIANFLSDIDLKIEKLTRKKELMEQYKKGMMQKLFSREIRFKDDNGNDYPPWQEKKLGEVADSVDYRGKTPEKVDYGVQLITARNIKCGFIDYNISEEYIRKSDYEEVMRRGKPRIGDVLITTEAPLGNVAQVDNEKIALAQRVIKYRGKQFIDNTFLKYSFLARYFKKSLDSRAYGSTVKGIKGAILKKILIKLPALHEQQKIANFLTNLDKKIELIEKELCSVKEFKKGLLQKMFI
jgi:type I restriction enzyme S subunit